VSTTILNFFTVQNFGKNDEFKPQNAVVRASPAWKVLNNVEKAVDSRSIAALQALSERKALIFS